MIRPAGRGKFVVVSKKTGKRLSKPLARAGALRRLRQVEYFKRQRSPA